MSGISIILITTFLISSVILEVNVCKEKFLYMLFLLKNVLMTVY